MYDTPSEMLLPPEIAAAQLAGDCKPKAPSRANRVIQTEANLGRLPEVAKRALGTLHVQGSATRCVRTSWVSADDYDDLRSFSGSPRRVALATRLARLGLVPRLRDVAERLADHDGRVRKLPSRVLPNPDSDINLAAPDKEATPSWRRAPLRPLAWPRERVGADDRP